MFFKVRITDGEPFETSMFAKLFNLSQISAIDALAVSAGIAWGVATSKLKALEIRLAVVESEHKMDHDLLIEINTKLDILIQRAYPVS
jgi:hypothetical protein